jgi:hypothetical protein
MPITRQVEAVEAMLQQLTSSKRVNPASAVATASIAACIKSAAGVRHGSIMDGRIDDEDSGHHSAFDFSSMDEALNHIGATCRPRPGTYIMMCMCSILTIVRKQLHLCITCWSEQKGEVL